MMKPKMKQEEIDSRIVQLGERLVGCTKKKEQETGLTQNQQGDEMGIKGPSLSRYHETESKNPLWEDYDKKIQIMGVNQLIRICDYYGVSADYMLGFTDDEFPIRKNGDNLVKEICAFTGLTRQTIEKLHIMNNARREIVERVLLDDELFYSLMNFFMFDLLDIYVESDYATLPHRSGSPVDGNIKDRKEIGYASLLRELPLAQKRFSDSIKKNKNLELKMVHAMASLVNDPVQSGMACTRKFNKLKQELDEEDITDDERQQRLNEAEANYSNQKILIQELLSKVPPYGKNRFSNRKLLNEIKRTLDESCESIEKNIG